MVCSNEQLLNKEIEHLRNAFHHTNGYPKAVIQNGILKVKEEQSTPSVNIKESHQDDFLRDIYLFSHIKGKEEKKHFGILPKK